MAVIELAPGAGEIVQAVPDIDYDNFPYDPADYRWGNPLWPVKVAEFRDWQIQAIVEILDAYRSGARVVVLDAPTGAGKTVIGEATRRLLGVNGLYVANTKGLQDQFATEFDYAKVLKGRANYPTLDHPELFKGRFAVRLTAADCTMKKASGPMCGDCPPYFGGEDDPGMHCSSCHPVVNCPYQVAKREALNALVAVTNTAYFVSEANGPGRLQGQDFVVVDEADTLESILLGFIEVHLSERMIERYEIEPPARKTVADAWLPWATQTLIQVRQILSAHNAAGVVTVEQVREQRYLMGLASKLGRLCGELAVGNAIYDGYDQGDIRFKPIRVASSAPGLVWQHSKRWLCMSATFVSAEEWAAEEVGLDGADIPWALVKVPAVYPAENRPIIVAGQANMIKKEQETAWPAMADGVAKVLRLHPDERVLVHTVSYGLARYLHDQLVGQFLPRPIMVYTDSSQREPILAEYRSRPASVLLAASMDRGVDLPYDDCRVVVVAKMPQLNLGDKQINARMRGRGGQLWYSVQCIRSLVQMTGRGVRSATDTCTMYILDMQFTRNIWQKNKALLPEWWRDSLNFGGAGVLRDV